MAKNYKQMYENAMMMLGKYQDVIVPGLREQLEKRVEIVRCKDCKHGEIDDPDFPDQYYCKEGLGWKEGEFFCSYGERKEG